MIFDLSFFGLTYFLNQQYFRPRFLGPEFFWTKVYLDQNLSHNLLGPIIFGPTFFGPITFWTKNYLGPRFVFDQQLFGSKVMLDQMLSFELKNLLD